MKIWDSSNGKIGEKQCLNVTMFAVNETVGLEGHFTMLLVYGLILRTARKLKSETQLIGEQTIEQGMKQVEIYMEKSRVKFAL